MPLLAMNNGENSARHWPEPSAWRICAARPRFGRVDRLAPVWPSVPGTHFAADLLE